MNQKIKCQKAENCFANARSFLYTLPVPIDEKFLTQLEELGPVTVKRNFRRPFFMMQTREEIQMKGILNDVILKVGYQTEDWEAQKMYLEGKLEQMTEEKGEFCGSTESVCPVCLKKIPARKVRYGSEVYMEKNCPSHGEFRVLIWRGAPDYDSWGKKRQPVEPVNPVQEKKLGCPYDCGLCPDHRQRTCCVLLEVTQRCNLCCPTCFASAGEAGKPDPTLEEIGAWYDKLMECGGPFNIQLSGGEPSLRDDIPKIIRLGREKGFVFFQLNTNGIRLAEDPTYVKELAAAGLNCAFLQFDGFKSGTYEILRGRDLLEIKKRAIANCKEAGIGVVLVPVLAAGVNTDEVGEILQFALEQMPAVRGVHFQPISYFGRYDSRKERKRYTLPDLLRDIERQTDGQMKAEHFTPGGAENPYCSFSGNFVQMEDGTLRPWNAGSSCGCGSKKQDDKDAARRAQKFVARRWSAGRLTLKRGSQVLPKQTDSDSCCCGSSPDTSSLDAFLDRVENHSLAVSCMAFMDAWNLDLERLKECYIHIVSQKEAINLVPFCAYNLTAQDGQTLYRGHESDEQR